MRRAREGVNGGIADIISSGISSSNCCASLNKQDIKLILKNILDGENLSLIVRGYKGVTEN